MVFLGHSGFLCHSKAEHLDTCEKILTVALNTITTLHSIRIKMDGTSKKKLHVLLYYNTITIVQICCLLVLSTFSSFRDPIISLISLPSYEILNSVQTWFAYQMKIILYLVYSECQGPGGSMVLIASHCLGTGPTGMNHS